MKKFQKKINFTFFLRLIEVSFYNYINEEYIEGLSHSDYYVPKKKITLFKSPKSTKSFIFTSMIEDKFVDLILKDPSYDHWYKVS